MYAMNTFKVLRMPSGAVGLVVRICVLVVLMGGSSLEMGSILRVLSGMSIFAI
jgi:hypothetical protein